MQKTGKWLVLFIAFILMNFSFAACTSKSIDPYELDLPISQDLKNPNQEENSEFLYFVKKGDEAKLSKNITLAIQNYEKALQIKSDGETRKKLEECYLERKKYFNSLQLSNYTSPKNFGNINNLSFIAYQDGWFYYRNHLDNGKLYKVRSDGTDKIKLSDNESNYINVSGEWIVFANGSKDNKIFKCKLDGTEESPLIKDETEEKGMYLFSDGNTIFYCNISDYGYLYQVGKDGLDKKILIGDESLFVNVSGEWVYYCNNSDNGSLYKIKKDGSHRTKLSDDMSLWVQCVDEWIYYVVPASNLLDSGKLFKIKLDGSSKKQVSNDEVSYLNVFGEWIFYRNVTDEGKLYKMKTDGLEKIKLNDAETSFINIVDSWIFYKNETDGGRIYRIRFDGKNNQKFE